jgi:hypothetical protein
MKCFHPLCTVQTPQGTLFRVNEKGVPGIWACRIHIKQTDAKIAPEVDSVVRAIEGGSNGAR